MNNEKRNEETEVDEDTQKWLDENGLHVDEKDGIVCNVCGDGVYLFATTYESASMFLWDGRLGNGKLHMEDSGTCAGCSCDDDEDGTRRTIPLPDWFDVEW